MQKSCLEHSKWFSWASLAPEDDFWITQISGIQAPPYENKEFFWQKNIFSKKIVLKHGKLPPPSFPLFYEENFEKL